MTTDTTERGPEGCSALPHQAQDARRPWCDLGQMDKIDWEAVQAKDWRQHKEGKQAEFLIEQQFPWKLVSRIGVRSPQVSRQTLSAIEAGVHQPPIDIKPEWYY